MKTDPTCGPSGSASWSCRRSGPSSNSKSNLQELVDALLLLFVERTVEHVAVRLLHGRRGAVEVVVHEFLGGLSDLKAHCSLSFFKFFCTVWLMVPLVFNGELSRMSPSLVLMYLKKKLCERHWLALKRKLGFGFSIFFSKSMARNYSDTQIPSGETEISISLKS